ncbi:MAG: hypothetical protein ACREOC_15490 [Gemmatimonadales bacterium]
MPSWTVAIHAAAGWLLLATACAPARSSPVPAPSALVRAESLYADLRALRDRIEVTTAAARPATADGAPLDTLVRRYHALRRTLIPELATLSPSPPPDDGRALRVMRAALDGELGAIAPASGGASTTAVRGAPDCDYDARAIAALSKGLDSLTRRAYACYGWAQHHVMVGGERMDRLSVLSTIARTEDRDERRRLFLALDPVWRSVNADGGASSPYRQIVALTAHRPGERPAAVSARALGIEPDTLERWLVAMLEAWRRGTPDTLIEPWDWHYLGGAASRRLSTRIPPARLAGLNAEVFRALGADPESLEVRYDLTPREGKTPVAFTTFGARARRMNGAWTPAEPWVFATYRTGGLDNLNELLHETGHAVHIAAIRTRPAFTDWPDSDPFTEGLADVVALDAYEPAWQQRWLGDSATTADALRGRYAGIVLDVAWALFEIRMQREPEADPNQVWSAITHEYLRIRPHPDLSWWAMRGQLINLPGYMLNYAAGAVLIAAIRERIRELHGPFTAGDLSWYGWVAPRLYRFGLERSSRDVIEAFLGGPVTPDAILRDMGRLGG